jgi:thiamine biosynthesis lipoprotein
MLRCGGCEIDMSADPGQGSSLVVDRYEPLLGTTVEIRIELSGEGREREADGLSEAIVEEIVRLQSVFSSVDPTSEFRRWARGEVDELSAELTEVLELAAGWQQRSSGRFTPAVGALSAVWQEAERTGALPDQECLDAVVTKIAEPRWTVVDGVVTRLADASDCTLNALAKGWISDSVLHLAEVLAPDGCELLCVNAGGDLAHRGARSLIVGIEDPFRPVDNLPPIATVELRDCGLATSGGARRWFEIDGRRRSHVLDPRTGQPVDHLASISVVAADCATADVLCTTLGLLHPDEAIAEADAYEVACLIIDAGGFRFANAAWSVMERLS